MILETVYLNSFYYPKGDTPVLWVAVDIGRVCYRLSKQRAWDGKYMACLTLDNIIDMEKSVWIRVTIIIMMLGPPSSVYEGGPKLILNKIMKLCAKPLWYRYLCYEHRNRVIVMMVIPQWAFIRTYFLKTAFLPKLHLRLICIILVSRLH